MWSCPKCQENLEDQFDSCWKCSGNYPVVEGASSHWHEPVSVKKGIAIWVGVSFAVAAFCWWLTLLDFAGSHRSHEISAALFPHAFLSFYLLPSEIMLFVLILVQFPAYGAFFGWAWSKHREFWAAFWILGTHIVLGFSVQLLHKVDYFVNRGINPFSP